jgi:hypothetical protein
LRKIIGTFQTFLASVISKLIETPRRSVFTLIIPLVVAVIGLQALTFTPGARFIDRKNSLAFMARESTKSLKSPLLFKNRFFQKHRRHNKMLLQLRDDLFQQANVEAIGGDAIVDTAIRTSC